MSGVSAGTGIAVTHTPAEGSSATIAVDTSYAGFVPTGVINMWATTTAPTNWLLCDGTAVSRSTYAALFAVISTTYGVGDGSTTFNLPNLKGKVPVGRDSANASFDTMGELGGAKTHTLTSTEMPSHTHTQDSHNHTQDAHNHTQNAHGHTVDAHSHLNYYMTGTAGAHSHTYDRASSGNALRASGTLNTSGTVSNTSTNTNTQAAHDHTSIAYTGDTSPGVSATTATNQAQTATNQAQTATNQNTGGGGAHNNLQPYIVLNYIIKA
jgi:microcystin-dependent protein